MSLTADRHRVLPPADLLDAFDRMAAAAVVLDPRQFVAHANAGARTLFGGGLTGRPIAGVFIDEEMFSRMVPGSAAKLREVLAADGEAGDTLAFCDGRSLCVRATPLAGGGTVVVMHDVTPHVQSARFASRDPLTGLPNRLALGERLAETVARSQRSGEPAAVLCLDLDRFKTINDSLGHPVGDALLRTVAERMKSALRQGDFIARLGGDEFAIVQLGGGQPVAAEALARRLIDLVGRAYVVDGHMLNIGVSIGIALVGTDSADPVALVQKADLALYRAKADGRGTFRFFEQAMNEHMQARRELEMDLRKALALKEFEIAYQPLFDVGVAGVAGFEALLRWRHGTRGNVSPADFIPLAEEIGLITPIGEWVLRTACLEAATWPDPISVAVNLSPVQFRGAKLAGVVTSALAAAGLSPSRLELEITEGALLDNTDTVLATLRQLRAIGVKISMDDFGTGYSSLGYLQKFPFDKIKIDQSFVRGMIDSKDCAAIVRAVTAMSASLGIRTTAEGVETQEQFDRIRQEGCSQVQGYLTGRPLAPEAAARLARAAD